ncbi:hypothetical protein D1BOALGB6SA_8300 [Olavius sp. associated proteobacterium Delta 1]|nr:hypothetical protein D1BOALGB6SA_8300 [Olavius sp. associated proteobacterium Delta 1]
MLFVAVRQIRFVDNPVRCCQVFEFRQRFKMTMALKSSADSLGSHFTSTTLT